MGPPHPSTPWYYSHAIETQSGRNRDNITSGVPDRIFAKIRNNDSAAANRVRVSFGFYPFTAGIPTFYDIGSVVVDLPGSMDREVSIDWIPPVMTAGDEHGCLVVTIDYGYDKKFANRSNSAQKNVRVERTSSPAEFDFRVENTLPTKANIHLEVENQIDGWEMKLSEYDFVADPAECARTIRAVVTPTRQHTEGMEALFFVSAYAAELGTEKYKPIGGVALKTLYGKDTTVRPPTNIVVVAGGLALLLFAYFWYTRSRRD